MTTTNQCQAETRFVALMAELFQMDEAQALDFGFYRIIRRHNREVRAFLGEVVSDKDDTRLVGGRLMELLDSAFQVSDLEDAAGDHFRLREIESQLGLKPGMTARQREAILIQAEAIPISQHLVAEYRGRVATLASRQTASQDRAEVLNRLYQFFSRHYQDGDFIVARRYGRGGARYIRSTGEDTEFHWATEDMYYIKSGDIFTDFPVRLSNGQSLLFTVEPEGLQATRAALKPNDKAHYEIMAARRERDVVKVVLRYLKGAQSDRHKDEIVNAAQKAGAPVALNQEIRRWLNRFIARNQSDFFIHKRLREALGADLDIFIKTEVLDLDQILVGALTETDISRRALRVARLVREIGMPIIDFLATLEDFQKALWEKKKLVLQTRYVITLDRLERLAPEWLAEHIEAIVIRQRNEWRALGLGDRTTVDECLRATAPTQTRIALSDNPAPDSIPGTYLPLPIDTGNFDENFKWSLLAAITACSPLDDAVDGVAIHSDNWQALNTLETKYREQVKCSYIDPPYNTNASGIPGGVQYQLQHLSVNGARGLVKTLHHGPVDANRWKVAVDGPGPLVETLGDRIELFLAVDGQVGALRQVLAQEAVGVLAGPALPGAMRVAEVDLDPGLGGQLGMARHLLPLVIGQGLAQRCGDAVELPGIACQSRGGSGIVHFGQQDQARAPLDQDPDRRTVTRPLDEVTLPVARQGAVLYLGWTDMNAQHISQLSATIRASGPRQAGMVGLAQAGDQFLAQGTPRQSVEAGVNGLGGDPPRRGFRPHHGHRAGNLTGRPTLPQKMLDHAKQHAVHGQLGQPPRLEAAAPGFVAGPVGVVAAAFRCSGRPCMPAPFPADRRGGTVQGPRDGTQTLSLLGHHPDRRPFFGRQLFEVLGHHNTYKCRGVAFDSRLRPL
jgi:hypothetical protein